MIDRELLTLAAKAIGLDFTWDGWADAPMVLTADGIDTCTWNPLASDGDALRLAVALQAVKGPSWVICLSIGDNRSACEFNYAGGGDAAANVRRAIVLAAAEHAKAMRP